MDLKTLPFARICWQILLRTAQVQRMSVLASLVSRRHTTTFKTISTQHHRAFHQVNAHLSLFFPLVRSRRTMTLLSLCNKSNFSFSVENIDPVPGFTLIFIMEAMLRGNQSKQGWFHFVSRCQFPVFWYLTDSFHLICVATPVCFGGGFVSFVLHLIGT